MFKFIAGRMRWLAEDHTSDDVPAQYQELLQSVGFEPEDILSYRAQGGAGHAVMAGADRPEVTATDLQTLLRGGLVSLRAGSRDGHGKYGAYYEFVFR